MAPQPCAATPGAASLARAARQQCRVRIEVLGPLQLSVDGHRCDVTGSTQRGVLAHLALHANRLRSTDELINRLWGSEPPSGARQLVRRAVSALREHLDDAGAPPRSLTSDGCAHALVVPEPASDLLTVRGLLRRGREASRNGRHHDGASAARAALALWRGPELVDVPAARSWPELAQLREERLQLLEDRLRAELACGAELVDELYALTSRYPWREQFQTLLLAALHGAARDGEARQVYDGFAAALANQWGLDPGSGLKEQRLALDVRPDSTDRRARTSVALLAVGMDDAPPRHGPFAFEPFHLQIRRAVTAAGGELLWEADSHILAVFTAHDRAAAAVGAAFAVRDAAAHRPHTAPRRLDLAVATYDRGHDAADRAGTGVLVDADGMAACRRLLTASDGSAPVVDPVIRAATSGTVAYRLLASGTWAAVRPLPTRPAALRAAVP